MDTIKLATTAALAVLLGACGGGSSSTAPVTPPPPAAAQPSPLTAVGTLTGFGSVYVNGVEYETTTASYEVDDQTGSTDDDLDVGMVVTVKGTVNDDGKTGTAESVSYDDEIEGPASNLFVDPADATIKRFSVFGVDVVADGGTVFAAEDDPAFGFATFVDGDNVEVSGQYQGTTLFASYIQKQGVNDNEFEVRGTISAFDGVDKFTITLDGGATMSVTVAAGAAIPTAGIVDGQYAEVEGTIPDPVGAPSALLASKVEIEDEDDFDEGDDDVEIKGPLTHDAVANTWSVNGTEVTFGTNTTYEPQSLSDGITDGSADGVEVEVKGNYVNGALQADEVKNEEEDLKFKAVASAINATDAKNGTITLSFGAATGTVDVIVDGSTLFMDGDALTPFDLTTMATDTMLEIKGRQNAAGNIVASKLHIEDGIGIEIEGPLATIDAVSVSVLGVQFSFDALTQFPNGTPVVGDNVSIGDTNADGTAEMIEIDD